MKYCFSDLLLPLPTGGFSMDGSGEVRNPPLWGRGGEPIIHQGDYVSSDKRTTLTQIMGIER
jgi:hypothetical protein